jgi:hypothetical protein
MAKMFNIHTFELLPGVDAETFEQFIVEEVYPTFTRPEITLHILRGERGDRVGKYVFMLEIESMEVRNHYWPEPGVATDAWRSLVAPWWEKWQTLATQSQSYTDCVVVGK